MSHDSVRRLFSTQAEVKRITETASLLVVGTGFPFAKVGETWTVDGEAVGRVAATEYVHDSRQWKLWVLPEILYWHCWLLMRGLRLADGPLWPVHDRDAPFPRDLLLRARFPCRPFSVAERR